MRFFRFDKCRLLDRWPDGHSGRRWSAVHEYGLESAERMDIGFGVPVRQSFDGTGAFVDSSLDDNPGDR
jgi:hypothetical protein